MVSFSCDVCQDVVTKPKVIRHMQRCRGGRSVVSCLDCQRTFDIHTVRAHTSCITETEKFGPKKVNGNKETYCQTCHLELNGAVHALQHYESKKHRAALRRIVQTKKNQVNNGAHEANSPPVVQSKEDIAARAGEQRCAGFGSRDSAEHTSYLIEKAQKEEANNRSVVLKNPIKKKSGKISVRKAMKSILKSSRKQRMKMDKLVAAIQLQLGDSAPENLSAIVEKKTMKCPIFQMRKGRIDLLG